MKWCSSASLFWLRHRWRIAWARSNRKKHRGSCLKQYKCYSQVIQHGGGCPGYCPVSSPHSCWAEGTWLLRCWTPDPFCPWLLADSLYSWTPASSSVEQKALTSLALLSIKYLEPCLYSRCVQMLDSSIPLIAMFYIWLYSHIIFLLPWLDRTQVFLVSAWQTKGGSLGMLSRMERALSTD